MRDTAGWASSPSLTLRSWRLAFDRYISLQAFTAAAIHAEAASASSTLSASTPVSAISSLLDPATGAPSIDRLHHAAHRLLQCRLAGISNSHLLSHYLPTDPRTNQPLSALARARIRASGAPFAGALLAAQRIHPPALLTNADFTFWITHRTGLPHPSVPFLRLTTCHPRCKAITAAAPATGSHPLAYATPHAYHQLRCGATNARILAHNSFIILLASALAPLGFHADVSNHLQSSDTSRRQVDAVLTSIRRPRPLAVDASLSCPLLPSHLEAAAVSAIEVFAARAAEKIAKHAAGCELLQRDYLSFILTTLGGVGPPAFVEFLRDSFFHAGLAAVAAGTATASDANHAYHCFQESLQALVARGNSATVRRHTATDAAA